MTTKALAKRWSVSPRSLEGQRQRNVGPRWVKIGGSVRYPRSEIERFENWFTHSDFTGA
ncbi:helix-turn-helix domain-containing protein [Sphingorhabdus soli]|uniref:Helix-turn-helix domain-containing protein n=1 Tax=Flavisphingopyxis soli TaxID=2601267 RepID=A0A5C6U7K9_9SPHN|nr:helix-turn-helix domain-containing protein [Sphingorhabdus soli]